jgi:hypothetical protein
MKPEVLKKYSNSTLRALRKNLCAYKLIILPAEVKAYLSTPVKVGGSTINNKVRKVLKMVDAEIIYRFCETYDQTTNDDNLVL